VGDCSIDEDENTIGPGRCSSADECKGARTCADSMYCEGLDGCPEI